VGWMSVLFCARGMGRTLASTTKGGLQLLGMQYVFVLRFNVFKLFIIDIYENKSLPSSSAVNGQGSSLLTLSIKLNRYRH
jgi:hypothetical protein